MHNVKVGVGQVFWVTRCPYRSTKLYQKISPVYCRLYCYVCVCMYGLCHHYSCTIHCSIAFQKLMYTAQSACVTVGDINCCNVYLDRQWVERSLNKRAHVVYTFFNKWQLFLRGLYCQFCHTFCELSTTLLLELPCPFTAAICVCVGYCQYPWTELLSITIRLKEGSIVNKAWVIVDRSINLLAMISSQCL